MMFSTNNIAFFAVLLILILGVLYVLRSGDQQMETGMKTPKEYIEYVEKRKAERLKSEKQAN